MPAHGHPGTVTTTMDTTKPRPIALRVTKTLWAQSYPARASAV